MASCDRLAARADRIYYPAHGASVADPKARIDWLIGHRREREAQILAALGDGPPQTIPALTETIYTDTPRALFPAAVRNVFAHLIDLTIREMVRPHPQLDAGAEFVRIG